MYNENIVIEGVPQKNRPARIALLVGVVLIFVSFIVALYVFYYGEGYESFGFGYGGWYYWCIIYDSYIQFFISEFFNFYCYFGYILIFGIVAAIVGLIVKMNTEKCEITVTNSRIFGKVAHSKAVDIPLNQITGLHTCSFNGISVTSIGNVSNFHCMENQEGIMKAISYLLANPQSHASASAIKHSDALEVGEAEKLKQLKELLDSGIISQEEFDTKKKQILGL